MSSSQYNQDFSGIAKLIILKQDTYLEFSMGIHSNHRSHCKMESGRLDRKNRREKEPTTKNHSHNWELEKTRQRNLHYNLQKIKKEEKGEKNISTKNLSFYTVRPISNLYIVIHTVFYHDIVVI